MPKSKIIKSVLKICSILFVCGIVLSFCGPYLVRKAVFHPTKGMQVNLNEYGRDIESHYLNTKDGIKISVFYFPKKDSKKTILFFHGNAGNASGRFGDAVNLNNLGLNVLLVDYRGYGLSEGKPSEKGVYIDARAALKFLLEKKNTKENQIVIYGRSLGSAVAVDLAQYKSFAGVILVSPFTSGKDMASKSGLSFMKPFVGNPLDSYKKIVNLKSPLLVIHGTKDRLVPFEMGKRLYQKAKVKKKFVPILNAGHNDLSGAYKKQFFVQIDTFIKSL